jgi:hypothetical protein
MLHRIRYAMHHGTINKMTGSIELARVISNDRAGRVTPGKRAYGLPIEKFPGLTPPKAVSGRAVACFRRKDNPQSRKPLFFSTPSRSRPGKSSAVSKPLLYLSSSPHDEQEFSSSERVGSR